MNRRKVLPLAGGRKVPVLEALHVSAIYVPVWTKQRTAAGWQPFFVILECKGVIA
jgi:hypothetical protein